MSVVANKIGCALVAVLLSAACCLGPYAQAAYANAVALQYVGTALASIIAVLGVSPKVNGEVDFMALGEAYTSFVDGMAEAGADILKDTVSAWDKTLTQDIDWDNIGAAISSSTAELARMGEAGVIDLNALSMSGAFGLLPALLSLFMADQVGSSATVDIPSFMLGDVKISLSYCGDTVPGFVGLYNNHQYFSAAYAYYADFGVWTILYGDGDASGKVFLSVDSDKRFHFGQWSSYKSVWPDGSDRQYDFLNYNLELANSLKGQYMFLDDISTIWLKPGCSLYIKDTYGYLTGERYALVPVYDPAAGGWNTSIGTVTDNPDVNLGHDYWDDAKDRVDVLNPAAGAAVIGSDAVIDGDYVANRGSLGVITDWADINSWADALARARAGVAEGALDGTVSTTQTGTAVNVGTGELVTDTVGSITRPGSGTSVSLPLPGLFDGVVDAVGDKFPFCIPGDLYKCLVSLSAAPVAPAFDWTFALSHVGLTDVTIHIDLAPFDQVAYILRVCLSVTMTIGLIFLSIRLLNMWGGD